MATASATATAVRHGGNSATAALLPAPAASATATTRRRGTTVLMARPVSSAHPPGPARPWPGGTPRARWAAHPPRSASTSTHWWGAGGQAGMTGSRSAFAVWRHCLCPKQCPRLARNLGRGSCDGCRARAPFLARPPQRLLPPISGAGRPGVTRLGRRHGLHIRPRPTARRLTRHRDTPHRPPARSAVTIQSRRTAAVWARSAPSYSAPRSFGGGFGGGGFSGGSGFHSFGGGSSGGSPRRRLLAVVVSTAAALVVAVPTAAVLAVAVIAERQRVLRNLTLNQCGAATRGGRGAASGRGRGAARRGCPGLRAACSRRQEWSLLRDQMINPISLATAMPPASKALKSGHQANHAMD